MSTINFIHIPKNGGSSFEKICDKKSFTYRHHNFCPFEEKVSNSLVVIRNPKERVMSAIRYMSQKSNGYHLNRKLKISGILNEDDFILSWANKDSSYHYVQKVLTMYADIQKIGSKNVDLNWVFMPQYKWFNKPDNILIIDKLGEEFNFFSKKNGIEKKLPFINRTIKTNIEISKEAEEFIKKQYELDFQIWEYWSQVTFEERLNIDWSKHESFSNGI